MTCYGTDTAGTVTLMEYVMQSMTHSSRTYVIGENKAMPLHNLGYVLVSFTEPAKETMTLTFNISQLKGPVRTFTEFRELRKSE